jgi:hypothetical protein
LRARAAASQQLAQPRTAFVSPGVHFWSIVVDTVRPVQLPGPLID